MRILMLEPNFIPTSPAGSQMLLLANRLADKHEVTVIADKVQTDLQAKVEWIHLKSSSKSGLFCSHYHYDSALKNLAVKGRTFDIVHAVDPRVTIPPTLKYSCYIVSNHSCAASVLEVIQSGGMCYLGSSLHLKIWYNLLNKFKSKIATLLEWYFTHSSNNQIWVAVSKGLAEELRHFYRPQGTIEVIPNAILHERYQDLERFRSTTRARLAICDDSPVAIAVAHGKWANKGFFVLLEAIRKVPSSIVLLVVGGSRRLNHLRWEVQHLGINDRVRFAGFVDDPRPYYAAADLFVLPSYYEAFPLVHLEAAAAGLPILSTAVNGVSEWMVNGKTGFFISHDPADIAHKIQLLAGNPALRLSLGNGARQSVSLYTVKAMATAYENLYERVSGGLA